MSPQQPSFDVTAAVSISSAHGEEIVFVTSFKFWLCQWHKLERGWHSYIHVKLLQLVLLQTDVPYLICFLITPCPDEFYSAYWNVCWHFVVCSSSYLLVTDTPIILRCLHEFRVEKAAIECGMCMRICLASSGELTRGSYPSSGLAEN